MRAYHLIQQCLSAIAIANAANHGTNRKVDADDFEFGRAPILEEFSDGELLYRDLLESELPFMSMSMSMSMSFDYTRPTPSPTKTPSQPNPSTSAPVPATPSPTALSQPDNSIGVGCDEQIQTFFSVLLEVETAVGQEDFEDDVARALENALSAEYSFCDSRRFKTRRLDDSIFLLGDIAIKQEGNATCIPQSIDASNCYVAQANFVMSGGDEDEAKRSVLTSLESIVDNDQAFDDELMANGVVDVRLWEDAAREAALNGPLNSGSTQLPGRSAVVAVLSVAAGTIVAAVAMRKFGLGGVAAAATKAEPESEDSDSASFDDTLPITLSGSTAV